MAKEAVSEAGGGRLFTRQATGLVRSVSPFSHIVFNTFTAPAPFVLAIALFWTLGAFPGANLYVALTLGYVSGIVFAFAISTVTSAIPRTGGDYVFVGRILHPILGLISSFCYTVGVWLSAAAITLYLVVDVLGPSFSAIGIVGHSGTMLNWGATLGSNHGWQLGVGLVVIALAALVAGSGWKWALRVQNVGFLFTVLGLLVTAIVVLLNSGHDFVAQFNSYANPLTGSTDSYHHIIAAAQKQGINVSPGSHFINTWPAYGAVIGFSIYTFYSTNIAGEVRQAKTWKTPLAMSGAAAINLALCLIMALVFFHGFGGHFFTAANAVNGTKAWPFAAPPIYVLLASIAGGSAALAWFLGFCLVFTFFVVIWLQFTQPMRALFAYAFDGVLPLRVAKVSDRSHVPTLSLGIVTAATAGLYIWGVYTGTFFTVYATAVIITVVALVLMSLAVMAFSYLRPEIWRGSVMTARLMGIPVTVFAGVGALFVAVVNGFLYLHYPGLGITNVGAALRNTGIVVAAAIVVYLVANYVRRRQGISLAKATSEIPPE